jgi:4-diphosphocytidyl-2-C-methyl-D-erythritol kinase
VKLSAFAPAKINLFLHVGPLGADGYHPLCSLMSFADVGDRIALSAADQPSFEIDGPFAEELAGDEGDNLVVRAARLLAQEARGPQPPFRLLLTKVLPLAAGLGGGSSDAGAALRLIRDALALKVDDEALADIAAALGADGAACFAARPVIAEGRGEKLSPAPGTPVLDAVLVNPRVPCPTGAVYREFDRLGLGGADRPPLPDAFEGVEEVAAFLGICRNDLEVPAANLVPEIGEALGLLRSQPEALLTRLSGSGATAFALCAGDIEAEGLAATVCALRPNWWVRRCRLGGPWAD